LLVLAMTIGYSSTDTLMNRRNRPATTAHLCGGPTGTTAREEMHSRPPAPHGAKERARA
jgi:hypothetical protein